MALIDRVREEEERKRRQQAEAEQRRREAAQQSAQEAAAKAAQQSSAAAKRNSMGATKAPTMSAADTIAAAKKKAASGQTKKTPAQYRNRDRFKQEPVSTRRTFDYKTLGTQERVNQIAQGIDDEKERVLLARDCVNDQLTVRALEKRVARLHAPVVEKQRGTPDLPDGYVRSLVDKLKKHLGCAVRLTSGVTHANGKHVKGLLEIDFFDNDELDRVLRMIGVEVE